MGKCSEPEIQGLKSRIESVHLRYLCNNFSLETGREHPELFDGRFDLLNVDARVVFEMKSRIFPHGQRPKSDYEWWAPHNHQVSGYQNYCEQHGWQAYFLFVLGHTAGPLSELGKITERTILEREIYVLPWKVSELALGSEGKERRYIGLKKIKKTYEFQEQPVKKGVLYVPKTIEEAVGVCFGLRRN